jgi:hypothetical protein
VLQVLGAVDFDGCRVIKPDRYPVAVRMDGNAERFFTSKRCLLPFKLEVRPVAPLISLLRIASRRSSAIRSCPRTITFGDSRRRY